MSLSFVCINANPEGLLAEKRGLFQLRLSSHSNARDVHSFNRKLYSVFDANELKYQFVRQEKVPHARDFYYVSPVSENNSKCIYTISSYFIVF